MRPDHKIIGFDLGGTKMRVGVFDRSFRRIGSASHRHGGAIPVKKGITRIISLIGQALEQAGGRAGPETIGIACPGHVNPVSGMIYELVNLGWRDYPLGPRLADHFNCPVTVVNDVDAGAYGEYRFGAGRGARCLLGVFPGTGVGGACVLHGKPLQSGDISCFEIGHLPMVPAGDLCGCGRRGCLETVAGRLAIAQAAAAAVYRGEAPCLARIAGSDLRDIRSGALARAIAGGDRSIELIVRDAAFWLGQGIAGAVNLLSPDLVVLGGGLVEAMPEIYLQVTGDAIRERVMRPLRDRFKVVRAALGDDAVTMGAGAWAAVREAG